jgi:hypothetical protein
MNACISASYSLHIANTYTSCNRYIHCTFNMEISMLNPGAIPKPEGPLLVCILDGWVSRRVHVYNIHDEAVDTDYL